MSSAWAYGVRGAVGSTYNQFAKLYAAIIVAFETGDQSRVLELQNLSVDIIRVFQKYGFLASSKEVMKLVGVDCGTVRSPVLPLQAGELDEIASSLESLGAMQWA
jgi:N-acetylneuraminate lyase